MSDDDDLDARLVEAARAEGARNRPSGRTVTIRVLILSLMICSVMSITGAIAVDRLVLTPQHSQADLASEFDDELVWQAIEADSRRLDAVLDPAPSDISDRLDDTAATVEGLDANVEALSDDLDSLCSSLSLADALSSEILSCP